MIFVMSHDQARQRAQQANFQKHKCVICHKPDSEIWFIKGFAHYKCYINEKHAKKS